MYSRRDDPTNIYNRDLQAFQSGRYFSHKFKRNKVLLYRADTRLKVFSIKLGELIS